MKADNPKDIYRESCGGLLTGPAVQAGIELAHINLPLAEAARIARLTPTREVVDAIDTGAVAAQVTRAIVLVDLAARPGEPQRTVAGETVEGVATGAAVVAGAARAVVQVGLAVAAPESLDAGAAVGVDQVGAVAVATAGLARALVNVRLAVFSLKSCSRRVFFWLFNKHRHILAF
jgi:hypothetical protein